LFVFSAQQEGCCEVLIEDTKTTQNRDINQGKIKGKVLQRERASLNREVCKKCDLEGQENLSIESKELEKSVDNSYLEVDNWDFLNEDI